jgi:hypothetical protein
LVAFQRDAGLAVHPGCTKRQHPEQRCPLCPPMFPRASRDGRGFVTDRAPSSGDLSNMIVDGLRQVGFDMTLFSGMSASRGGLSTAIEAGVPEHILWMQSGHAQDVAARRYVQLGSPGRPSTCKPRPESLHPQHCSVLQEDGLSGRIRA